MNDLNELLIECAEALRNPGHEREGHLGHIDLALRNSELTEEAGILLRAVARKFQEHRRIPPMSHMARSDCEAGDIAEAIEAFVGPRNRVYHGTICGRLADITLNGLVPGKQRNWSSRFVPDDHLEGFVFFTNTWRGAMNWAQCAHAKSRGPKDGFHRTLAVIRLSTVGLTLQPDPLAMAPGCLKVQGTVPVTDAVVITGESRGYPEWEKLDAFRDTRKSRARHRSDGI